MNATVNPTGYAANPGLRFGMFFSPIHAPEENPTLALHRDVETVRAMDRLGYDEAWIGEHHSTGWEYISSPEVFLGYLAGLTHRIRLGTGVTSLPYHHPYNVAQRLILLDHLTRGRFMAGVGPGALVSDARQLGIDPSSMRPRMEESLETILTLLKGERITKKTDWFMLDEAKLQLPPYTWPHFEIACTATLSPSGARLAGKHGLSMLSLIATQSEATALLRSHWQVAEDQAAEHGQVVDRRNWRLVGPMHLAETEKQARQEVAFGLHRWIHYMTKVTTLQVMPESARTTDDFVDALVEKGYAVIGTPDQAIKQIRRLQEASGGFGAFLLWAHDWANHDATLRSLELFARHVTPAFRHFHASLAEAEEYARSHHAVFQPQSQAARKKAVDAYAALRDQQMAARKP